MTFPKRTFEKPIPISPTIALDRERCILCYRCTRFSDQVAEDGQLIAKNRGAASIIATFEDEPYRAPFSGNVIELCPVGALTSTQYRFEARPWEIQNVPSVCGLCPVGCNISATTREGKVKRILSRNHPEIDEGWLCDKGRFAFTHLYARDRVTRPAPQGRQAPLRGALLGRRARRGRAAPPQRSCAARALGVGDGRAGGGTRAARPAGARLRRRRVARAGKRRARRLPGAALVDPRTPTSSSSIGDDPVEERAPVVGLWLKSARRTGAEIVTVGAAGTIRTAPGAAADAVREQLAEQRPRRGARRADLVGPGRSAAERRVAQLADELGASAAFFLPATPNGRAVAEAWHAAGEGEPARPEKIGVLLVSGEEAAARSGRAQPRRPCRRRDRDRDVRGPDVRGWADLVLPGTSYLERDGTMVNLEGRPQRLRRAVIPPAPDELAWIAKLAERFGVEVDPHSRAVPAEERAAAAAAGGGRRDAGGRTRGPGAGDRAAAARCGCSATGRSSPARRSSGSSELQFQRPAAGDRALRRTTREVRGDLRRATRSSSARTEPRSACAPGSTGASSTAPSAPPRSTSGSSTRAVEVSKA